MNAACAIHQAKLNEPPPSTRTPMSTPNETPALKWILPIALVVIAIAACATVWFVTVLKPNSVGAFVFFAVWLVLPYAVMTAALIFFSRRGRAALQCASLAILLSIAGILFLADVIVWHPDAQGALAVLMAPVLQLGAFVILLPVINWVLRSR